MHPLDPVGRHLNVVVGEGNNPAHCTRDPGVPAVGHPPSGLPDVVEGNGALVCERLDRLASPVGRPVVDDDHLE
jgi:hypothetical protein